MNSLIWSHNGLSVRFGSCAAPTKTNIEQLAFVDYVELWIPVHERAKIFDFFFEGGLAVDVLVQDILIDSAQQRDQFKPGSELAPRRVRVAGIVADDLISQAESRSAVRQVSFSKLFTVENAAHGVGYLNQGRVHSKGFDQASCLLPTAGSALS